jgi:steroid delta-isomerase-like uncharacterized protein
MTPQEITAIAQTVYDCYNARDFERSASLAAEDVEIVNLATGQTFRGRAGLIAFLGGWAAAFPDSMVEVRRIVASEDGAAVEFVGRGTHLGPLAGPAGTIPPTGRTVEIPFHDAWEVRGGELSRGRLYFDSLTMLAQLGVAPAPPALDLTGVPLGEPAAHGAS